MTSISGTKPDLLEFAARLRVVAKTLRQLASDHSLLFEERKALCNEVKAVAAQLRGTNCSSS